MSEESQEQKPEDLEGKPPVEKPEGEKPKEKTEEKDDLAPIKDKLNKAYGERDSLKEEVEKLRKEKRDAELAHLKETGKEKEALEATISDRDEEIASLKDQIVALTRDNNVREVFTGFKFRNERAADLAFDQVTKELVQDDKGTWVHRSGKSIKDFLTEFSEDEDNKFLFVEKENRGTGIPPTSKPAAPKSDGKLAGKSQKEVLEMAAKGQLPNQRK